MFLVILKGLAANLINISMDKDLLVLEMDELVDGNSAENIKKSIEKIINKFSFDKYKIKGISLFLIKRIFIK